MWKGSALFVCLLKVATIWSSGKKLLFEICPSKGCRKGMCLGGITCCSSGIPWGR